MLLGQLQKLSIVAQERKRLEDTHKAVNGNGSTLVDIDTLPDVNIAARPARRTPPPAPTQKSKP